MRIGLRRGTAGDAPAAAELWLRARRAAAGAIPPTAHGEDEVRAWFASEVLADAELWVAEDAHDGLVGILVLDGPWVAQLYVAPGRTGEGIGAALLGLAKRRRPGGLQLWTFAANRGAQRFYERHGFVATRRTDGRDNEEGAPDVLYAWEPRSVPVVVRESELDWQGWPPDQVAERGEVRWKTLLSAGATPTEALTLGLARLAPGEELRRHHHAQAEAYLVLEGAGVVTLGAARRSVGAGDCVFIPGGAAHAIACTGASELRLAYVLAADSFDDVEYVFEP